ncbi:MAG: chemotaxis protein CheW [Chloroflexota bacterium]|nr:chemotaxis protein CheW [Chloroflexota bacterium]
MTTKAGFEKTGSIAPMFDGDAQLLTFRLDDQEYALDIANVVQVVRMVAITQVPKVPEVVAGVINLRGRVIPVINLRKRCGLPAKPYGLNDQLLIAKTDGRMMGLIVDVVSEVLTMPSGSLDFASEIGGRSIEYLSAVGKMDDRLLLILDPNMILTLQDQVHLEALLADGQLA